MKICCTCRETLPLDAFAKWSRGRDGLQNRCRNCFRIWYRRETPAARASIAARRAVRRQEVLTNLMAYFEEQPCVDCGEDDVRVLDLDHRDPTAKARNVSAMVSGAWNWETVLTEIGKCDVRCANCHRRVTAERAGTWRQKYWSSVVEGRQQRQAERLRLVLGVLRRAG